MPMSINRSTFPPITLAPGGGETLDAMGLQVTYKTTGRQSGGQFAAIETVEPPNSGSPVMWHKKTTVIIYVLEGRVSLRVGDDTIQAGPGSYAFVPPGTLYSYSNQSDAPIKTLFVFSPAGMEEYISGALELVKDEPSLPPADMSKIFALRKKYDMYEPEDAG